MKSAYSLKYQLLVFALCAITIPSTGLLLDLDHFRFALAGGKMSKGEEAGIKGIVKHFNGLFADLSNSMGKTNSDDLPATKAMRHKLYMDTGVNAMAKRALVYDMASLEILSVAWQDPRTAIVLTKEAWNYQYKDARNREELDIIRGLDDEFRYVLVKREGKWLVHRGSAIMKEMKKND